MKFLTNMLNTIIINHSYQAFSNKFSIIKRSTRKYYKELFSTISDKEISFANSPFSDFSNSNKNIISYKVTICIIEL